VDSATPAHLLRTNLLPLSYVPTKETRMDRELLRYRASLVKLQTGVKNRVHAVLAKNNINHAFSDLFGKVGKDFPDFLFACLQSIALRWQAEYAAGVKKTQNPLSYRGRSGWQRGPA